MFTLVLKTSKKFYMEFAATMFQSSFKFVSSSKIIIDISLFRGIINLSISFISGKLYSLKEVLKDGVIVEFQKVVTRVSLFIT